MFDAVKDMYEDKDDSLDEPPMVANRDTAIDQVNKDIDEEVAEEGAPKDFQVNEDGEVVGQAQEEEPDENPQEPQQEPADGETPAEPDYGF